MKLYITYTLILLAIFSSCTNVKEEKTQDGKIIKKYEYYNDENGSLIKNGEYQSWYTNGIVEYKGDYKENKRNGKWKKWTKENILKEDYNYKNDLLNGKCTTFNDSGKIQSVIEYLNGSYHGKKISYSNGKLYTESNYDNGNPIGKWKYFNDKKEVGFEMNFKNGYPKELIGKWKVEGKKKTYMEFFENYDLKYTYQRYGLFRRASTKVKNLTYEIEPTTLIFKNKSDKLVDLFIITNISDEQINLLKMDGTSISINRIN